MEISIRLAGAEEDNVKTVVKRRRQSLSELLSTVREVFGIPKNSAISLLDSLGTIEDAANIDAEEELTLVVGNDVENPDEGATEASREQDFVVSDADVDEDDEDDDDEPKKRRSKRKRTPSKRQSAKKSGAKKSAARRSARRRARHGPMDDYVDEIEESEDDGVIKVGKRKNHRTKSTSRRRHTKQAKLIFDGAMNAGPFDFGSDSEEFPDEPGQEDGDSIRQTDDDGFKFIGCFITALRGKGQKIGEEWDDIKYENGSKISFEVKTDYTEKSVITNVVATRRYRRKEQEVGRMLGELNNRLIKLMEESIVNISGEIYTRQVVNAASRPLLVKVFVYLAPDIDTKIPMEDVEGTTRTHRSYVHRLIKDIVRYERKIDPWWTHEAALDPIAKDFQDFLEDDDQGADMEIQQDEDADYGPRVSHQPNDLAEQDDCEGAAETGSVPAGSGAAAPARILVLPGDYFETMEALKAVPDNERREVWIRTHVNKGAPIPELEQDPETLKDSVIQSAALSMVSMQQIVQNDDNSMVTQDEILEACSMGTQATILDGIYKSSRFDKLQLTSPSANMATEMLPFQKQGLTWLKWRETPQPQNQSLNPFWAMFKSSESIHPIYISKETNDVTFHFVESDPPPLGGILADEMGMGKTVQILSLVDLVNCELKEAGIRDDWSRATLIVCTASVLDHWNSEIKKHFKPNTFSTLRYHGSNKPKDPKVISRHHIVFTTYDTLAREYADQLKGTKLDSDDEAFESPLLQVKWRRIILDEAHGVRDLTTKKSTAVFALESERRWCLTGTPVQNSLQDLYCLIKFLRVPIFTEQKWWNSLVTEPFMAKDNAAMIRLYDIIQPIMMRRLKNQKSSVDGQALLELPDLEKEVVLLDMTPEEETFYNYLYKRSKDEFEDLVFRGLAMRNYRKIIELISKVRQACCHPYLAIGSIYKKGLDAQLFYDSVNDPTLNISYLASTAEQMKSIQRLRCPSCFIKLYQLEELECGHHMCNKCCEDRKVWDDDIPFQDQKSENAFVRCTECNEPSAFKRINRLDRGVLPPDPRRDYLDSSKVKALVDDLKSHQEKAVVFSQWVTFLDILQVALERNGISFLRIDGSMTPQKRAAVIQNFRDSPSRVLFVSIKSGNAGIDLQVASRAYIMEPWWNPGVEEQAMHRVHRMGQTKKVVVKRYFFKNSIESRMLKLQEGKIYLSKFADQDKEALKKNYKLEELKTLFDDARLDMKGEIAKRNSTDGSGTGGGDSPEGGGMSWLAEMRADREKENNFTRRALGSGVKSAKKSRAALASLDAPVEDMYPGSAEFDDLIRSMIKPDPGLLSENDDDDSLDGLSPSKRTKYF